MSTNQVRGALVCAVLVLTSACQTTTTPPSPSPVGSRSVTPSAVVTTPTPTPTPTPTLRPPELSVRGFWATVDELRAATDAPPEISKLNVYGRGPAFEAWSNILMQGYGRGEHQVGKSSIVSSSSKPGATATQYVVTVCVDTTGVDIVDKSGKSVKSPEAVARNTAVHTVEQDAKDGRWYVMTYEGRRGC